MHENQTLLPALWIILLALVSVLATASVARGVELAEASQPGAGGVLITEFMAAPDDERSALPDEDDDASDWIELHNASEKSADLSNWALTDDPAQPKRWRFPRGTQIPAHGYLVVFASGKNRRMPDAELHTNFKLNREEEYLALVDGSGTVISSFDPRYPVQFTGIAFGLDRKEEGYSTTPRYFIAPTPGAPNPANLGPVISNVTHRPRRSGAQDGDALQAGEDLVVSAQVTAISGAPQLFLRYSFGFEPFIALPMRSSGDGVYRATIPSRVRAEGELIRYAVVARDDDDAVSYWPLRRAADEEPDDPILAPHGLGTVIGYDAIDQRSQLPIIHWFVPEDPIDGTEWYREALDAHHAEFLALFPDPTTRPNYNAGTFEDAGTIGALFYRGRYFDNIHVRLRGYWSKNIVKKSFEFNFNRDDPLYLKGDEADVALPEAGLPFDEMDIITVGRDAAGRGDATYLHELLAYRVYAAAGVPASLAFPIRMNLNGDFFSVSVFVEQPDDAYLARRGLEPAGTLVKVDYNDLGREHFILRQDPKSGWTSTDGLEQRLPAPDKEDRRAEVLNLIDGLNPDDSLSPAAARQEVTRYLLDRVNIPGTLNYLAARALIMDWDTVLHNYYLYRDSTADDTWMLLPWDKGETFFYPDDPAFQALQIDHPLHGSWALHSTLAPPTDPGFVFNHFYDAILQDPALRQIYLRRLRSVMDALLGPPAEPAEQGPLADAQIESLLATMRAEIQQNDLHKWDMTFAPETLFAFLARRRIQLYDSASFSGLIPGENPGSAAAIRFSAIVTGRASEEPHVALRNCSGDAVDLSGWSIHSKRSAYTFPPGAVIPGIPDYMDGLYLAVDADALRAEQRRRDPDGLYLVLDDLDADLLDAEVELTLTDDGGRRVTTTAQIQADCHYLYLPEVHAR